MFIGFFLLSVFPLEIYSLFVLVTGRESERKSKEVTFAFAIGSGGQSSDGDTC